MAVTSESSRIFVRNLPSALSEDDFRSHFSKHKDITDVRFFPQRRIGYVGFKSAQDAKTAVKHYNKSFIRMSRINVELARPITQGNSDDKINSAVAQATRTEAENATSPTLTNPLKRKRPSETSEGADAKLKQFLGVMQATAKSRTWQNEAISTTNEVVVPAGAGHIAESGIQDLSRKSKKDVSPNESNGRDTDMETLDEDDNIIIPSTLPQNPQSDKDWLQSKGSNLLPDDESMGIEEEPERPKQALQNIIVDFDKDAEELEKPETNAVALAAPDDAETEDVYAKIKQHGRLYVRNLPFTISEADLNETFGAYGALEEVHLPIDATTGKPKGYAFLLFADGDDASQAYEALDGKTYQGRLLHILPAQPRRENNLDDYALSQLPLKQQIKIKRKMESSSATNKWNPLYMNMNDVMSSISDRLGIDKSQLLDATSSDAAVKQALAETHVIQEAKTYFASKGVHLDSFKPGRPRGDTAILVKNFPYGTSQEEIRDLFSPHGQIKNLLIPPGGTMALVEFTSPQQGRSAFAAMKYRRIKDTILFLEKAPQDLFDQDKIAESTIPTIAPIEQKAKPNAKDLLQDTEMAEIADTSTLFVRNLNFTTSTEVLRQTFSPLNGFATARVKTRTDSSRPGELLSMGFGFVEFKSKESAQAALAAMNGYTLDGHILDVRPSQRVLDRGEEQRRQEKAKAAASQQTKIIVKNLPFETSKKEVRTLLGTYGQLRSVRVPKKFDRSARGFAFAEFTTAREAANAMQALKSTHLLGRRLHIEYAAQDSVDPEEEIQRMQQKVGTQMDKVTAQSLIGAGRRKFNIPSGQDAEG